MRQLQRKDTSLSCDNVLTREKLYRVLLWKTKSLSCDNVREKVCRILLWKDISLSYRVLLWTKLYVSFAKEPYKRGDILQKRPVTDTSLSCDHNREKTYRVVQTRRMPYLYRSFSAKEPYN